MSSARETINNDNNADSPLVMQPKSPSTIAKRKIVDVQIDEVKHVKVVEEVTDNKQLCCAQCEKKLKFINTFTCRCEKSFCSKHRFNDQHSCTFDYKSAAKVKLAEENPKVAPKKI